jgi:tetratricopeptide (TPR) repeat protein
MQRLVGVSIDPDDVLSRFESAKRRFNMENELKKKERNGNSTVDVERLVMEITTGTDGEDEQLRAFRRALCDGMEVPCDAFVIGEPVSVIAFDYAGKPRRGLVARCRREDGAEHSVSAADVVLAPHSSGGHLLAAYRRWTGLDLLLPEQAAAPARRKREHKVAASDIDLSRPIELAVLSIKENAARCRLVESDRVITLRASRLWHVVPGEIALVRPHKQWSYAGHPYLSGEIKSARLDVTALGLTPLALRDRGEWDPKDEYWGEKGEPIDEWAKPIIARGSRPAFEMEQVVPGVDPYDYDSDPICESNDLKDSGDRAAAYKILMELCQADLRCLDAHAHLGNFVFDHRPNEAIRHYEVGVRIGELSLPRDFDGLLRWGFIDNRPFMRCLQGFGLCLWRLGRFEEAEHHFDRMLWLNPSDNQGVRFLMGDVRARIPWEDRKEGTWRR